VGRKPDLSHKKGSRNIHGKGRSRSCNGFQQFRLSTLSTTNSKGSDNITKEPAKGLNLYRVRPKGKKEVDRNRKKDGKQKKQENFIAMVFPAFY
jgi:hypothetical protein